MLSLSSLAVRSRGAPSSFVLGLVACVCVGCPGVEPSTSGFGGAGGDPVPTSGGNDTVGGGGAAHGGAGGMAVGGMGAGGMPGCDADLATDIENCGKCGRACLADESVKLPRCIDGVCESFCESGFVNITKPANGPDDGCEAEGRRVFVTEDVMSVTEVGGVAGADALCQTLADDIELGGAWRAWLSEQAESSAPSVRFNKVPPAPYMLLDFTQVAGSWAALVGANTLDHPIDLTETMAPVTNTSGKVWTGTTASGMPSGNHCSMWSAAGKKLDATVGDVTLSDVEWTQAESLSPCDGVARLYCFEQ